MIKSKIYSNDLKNPVVNTLNYKSRNLSDGIQFLLWLCPQCSSTDTIFGHRNKIICRHCKSDWNLSGSLKIKPNAKDLADIKDWNEWQKKEIIDLTNKSADDDVLTKSADVRLKIFKKNSKSLFIKKIIYSKYADGDLVLTKNSLKFIPYDKKGEMIFNMKEIRYFVECVNKFVKFYYQDKPYLIEFKNKNSSRYVYFLKELQKSYSEE